MSDWIDVMKRKAERLAWEAAHPSEQRPIDEDSTESDAASRDERAYGMRRDPVSGEDADPG